MTTTPWHYNDNSLRDLLVSLAYEGMERRGMSKQQVAQEIGVTPQHLHSVLTKQSTGSLDLWNRVLAAVGEEEEDSGAP